MCHKDFIWLSLNGVDVIGLFIYESTRSREIEHTGFLEVGGLELVCPPPHTALRMVLCLRPERAVSWDAEGTCLCDHREIIKDLLSADGKMPRT